MDRAAGQEHIAGDGAPVLLNPSLDIRWDGVRSSVQQGGDPHGTLAGPGGGPGLITCPAPHTRSLAQQARLGRTKDGHLQVSCCPLECLSFPLRCVFTRRGTRGDCLAGVGGGTRAGVAIVPSSGLSSVNFVDLRCSAAVLAGSVPDTWAPRSLNPSRTAMWG